MRSIEKWSILYVLLCLFLIHLPFSGNAQTKLSAGVSHNPVAVGQQFRLNFELNASGSIFTAPDLSAFQVLSGPNQSKSMQFINGNMSQSLTYSYILQAVSEGKFTIGSASVITNGVRVNSNPVTINVVKGSQGKGTNSQGNKGQVDKSNISSKNIFIRVEVNKRSVFMGEAVVATYKLYSNVPLVNYGINKVPALNGFWSQDIELPSQLQLYNEVYNGVNYQVGDIKKVVLYPQQTGTLVLDPMEGECIARVKVKRGSSNSPFDVFNDPFFNDPFLGFGGVRDVKLAVKSNPVQIKVKELPKNAPGSYSGAVGKFSIESIIDNTTVKANDAITVRIKISGRGNLNLIDAPALKLSTDIEQYEPKISDKILVNDRGSSGSRTFEYLLIPRYPGMYEIPPTIFTYFDVLKKQYVRLSTKSIQLKIEKGSEASSAVIAGTAKSDFQLLNREIRFIKTNVPNFDKSDRIFYGSGLFWTLILFPVLLFIGLLAMIKKRKNELADVVGAKSKRATKLARKKLKLAAKLMQGGDERAFYEEVTRASWGFIGDKLKIPVSDLSKSNATIKLQESGVHDDTINRIMELIEYCEQSNYAGQKVSMNMEEVYSSVETVISKIEDEYKA